MKNILMNTEMTRAILDGQKVQTRRAIPEKFKNLDFGVRRWWDGVVEVIPHESVQINKLIRLAKYQIGETMWVREPARVVKHLSDGMGTIAEYLSDNTQVEMNCDDRVADKKWFINCQGIPNGCIKEMARIFLKVTNVRVERLQDISDDDCEKEGLYTLGGNQIADTGDYDDGYWTAEKPFLSDDGMYYANEQFEYAEEAFEKLWNKTAPKGYKYLDNPFVFVYTFERVNKKDI